MEVEECLVQIHFFDKGWITENSLLQWRYLPYCHNTIGKEYMSFARTNNSQSNFLQPHLQRMPHSQWFRCCLHKPWHHCKHYPQLFLYCWSMPQIRCKIQHLLNRCCSHTNQHHLAQMKSTFRKKKWDWVGQVSECDLTYWVISNWTWIHFARWWSNTGVLANDLSISNACLKTTTAGVQDGWHISVAGWYSKALEHEKK